METVGQCEAVQQEPPFSNEVWELILECLSAKQLLPVRLTCRRLKDLVDNSSRTREKFQICFHPNLDGYPTRIVDLVMDENYRPVDLFPTRRVTIEHTIILDVDSWWPSLAENLVDIFLEYCTVTVTTLTGMLRQVVNLKRFSIGKLRLERRTGAEEANVDFELVKMETLDLYYLTSDSAVWSLLGRICPNLKEVRFISFNDDCIIELIHAKQNTLETLSIRSPFMLNQISQMKQLRLKRAFFVVNHIDQSELLEFGRAQPALEELAIGEIRHCSQIFGLISQCFPNLKRCHIATTSTLEEHPMFFRAMTKLKHLVVHYNFKKDELNSDKINFTNCRGPELEYLKIVSSSSIFLEDFGQFLDNCPNLRSLSLTGCRIREWSDIFTQKRLKFLQSLDLNHVTTCKTSPLEQLSNLKYLWLSTSKEILSIRPSHGRIVGTCIQFDQSSRFSSKFSDEVNERLRQMGYICFEDRSRLQISVETAYQPVLSLYPPDERHCEYSAHGPVGPFP